MDFKKGELDFEAKAAKKQDIAYRLAGTLQLPLPRLFAYRALPMRTLAMLPFTPWQQFDYARPPLLQD